MPQVEDDVLQVANIAVYGLRRFWLLHWKVILVTVSITIVAGIIVAKIMRGNERLNKYNREAVTNKTPWGWIIGGISVCGLTIYALTRKDTKKIGNK